MQIRTRFAPSPTGHLHLGHAYAAWVAFERAKRQHGEFLLRFEDIDHTRVRPEFYDSIRDDLEWLGLHWDEETPNQLSRLDAYQDALERLKQRQVVYPCFCTRRDIELELERLNRAPHLDETKIHYPGTCRTLSKEKVAELLSAGASPAWRLNIQQALHLTGPLHFFDEIHGLIKVQSNQLDDLILARRDIGTSYHLAVVVDDAAQGISHVTRGDDLLEITPYHRILQELLGFPVTTWHHHALIHNEEGKRLAKRDLAKSLRSLREAGWSVEQVFACFP